MKVKVDVTKWLRFIALVWAYIGIIGFIVCAVWALYVWAVMAGR